MYQKENLRMEIIKALMAYHLEGRKLQRVVYKMEVKR